MRKVVSMEKKRMIVLSLDAVGGKDMEYMETLPNFRRFMKEAAVCRQVRSVYPSLTYPAHTSIVTGRYPCRHGIVNNVKFQPGRLSPDWFWQREAFRDTTLYDEAYRHGMKVAALLWPVTGKARSITYNLPEVLPNRPWETQLMVSFLNGSPRYELDLQRRFGFMRDGIRQPQLDNFVQASMIHTLKHYQPDLMLVHMTDVDTNRHEYGVESEEAREALRRHDDRLGELMRTVEDMGWKEETDIVVLGDHYQMDVHKALYPNYYFRQKGYLTVKKGKLADWRVIARDCDGSCYIYLRDASLYKEAAVYLKELKKVMPGIARICTGKQAAAMGADGRCAFMLEAEPGYYFQNGWDEPEHETGPGMFMEGGFQAATHGFTPNAAGYETFFMAAGPHFEVGAVTEDMCLVDEGPTLAFALGLKFPKVDGKILKELLSKNTFNLPDNGI